MPLEWPPIHEDVVEAVTRQLLTSTSIYGRTGVIAEFEDRFRAVHRRRYGLLTSSGTAALHSAYYALGIGPGDEVLCPAYTFFATAVPLFQLGALPVLVDAMPQGLLDLDEAERLVTGRTRAMVITHMWGQPHPVGLYRDFCDRHGLRLVEDCSHAHGATLDGVRVGSESDVAAWSLQAGKLIAAGEGGILCTDDEEIYARATLLGHFNKRALAEIPPDSPLYKFAETGLGLKYRAHPLGVAMAMVYLDRMDEFLRCRARNALSLQEAAASSAWLDPWYRVAPGVGPTYYAYPMLVRSATPETARAKLTSRMHELGFTDFDIPASTRSLSTFPLFQSPVSPVADYHKPVIRRRPWVAEYLSQAVVKVAVPATADDAAAKYLSEFQACLAEATASLGAPPGDVAPTAVLPHQQCAIDAAARRAAEDGIEQLVVGAIPWRVDQGELLVLVARRRDDDFMGGYEELVGGGVEPGESVLDALRREVTEETGAQVTQVEDFVGTFDYRNEWGRRARQLNFGVRLDREITDFHGPEHVTMRWIGAADIGGVHCTDEVRRLLGRWFVMSAAGLVADQRRD